MVRRSKRSSRTLQTPWASPNFTLLIFMASDGHCTHITRIAYTRAERSAHSSFCSSVGPCVGVGAGGVEELVAPPLAAAAAAALLAAAAHAASAGPACNSTSSSFCIARNAWSRFLNVAHTALSPEKWSIDGTTKLLGADAANEEEEEDEFDMGWLVG